MSKLIPGEMLYLYLAVFDTTGSSALIRTDNAIELPVYYVGKGFTLAESRYPNIEKMALALIVTARKLRHYFQAHFITLFTNCPLRQSNQIEVKKAPLEAEPSWKLYVDGSVTKAKSGEGIILVSPDGFKYKYALEFKFATSNNAAEYKVLIGGLQLPQEIRVRRVQVFSDSQLVVNQVSGTFEANEPHLNSYQTLAKALLHRFESATVTQVPRKENSNADALARLATGTRQKGRKKVKIEILDRPSITKTISEIFAISIGPREPTWMDPIIEFIKEGARPKNRRQVRKLQSRCARYTLINNKLYRRGYCFPNLKCVSIEEGETILRDIHEGVCDNHSGSRSMSHKALRTGYFWPNMGKMEEKPFAQWGPDLVGKLPTAPGQFKYVIVEVDYYTKWVEAELLSRITIDSVPETIVTHNGTQFNNPNLIQFTEDMGTQMVFASVAHPKTNGQIEAVNKIIKKLLKKKLDDAKGLWA
ncbi:PREDICTED: uncharacterized protein LOC101309858 [Fragaria vesca subsp. vesca]|uniref:uncharacterized protein LOC101309858 n=1 Tax=Fragaria vesca subsp. vesca TaxID=101020 RepID=UPI0002C34BAD|nr:PREDICTED: uncharacterized protein LOC101309858 [Fragaria vesca subsp. vesca]